MNKLMLAVLLILSGKAFSQNPIFYMLVGTYTGSTKAEGIYLYRFNPNKGEATLLKTVKTDNPSYLCVSPDGTKVYAVNENPGDKDGYVTAFSLDKTNGDLIQMNQQPVDGYAPCHISADSSGKIIITANYSGGNITVFHVDDNGGLKPHSQLVGHEGYGVNIQRQEMPHPHTVLFSPDNKFVFVPDLGNDRLYQYLVNSQHPAQTLTPAEKPYYVQPDGNGPRTVTFSPDGKTLYLLNELSGDIVVYGYDGSKISEKQIIKSDVSTTKGDKSSAHIALTPNGKFLYTSNRGVNELVIFKVQSDGTLVEAGRQAVAAKPRFFMIDPTGRFLLLAAQDGNKIQVFVINKNFGLLQDAQLNIDIPSPTCIVMTPVK
jgi:6-phosphogluconolactonase